jgi:hypothetical protein
VNAERAFLLAMAFGLILIGQPWSRLGFAFGFPVTLSAIIAYNIVTRKNPGGPS